jgi:hypothetical protein
MAFALIGSGHRKERQIGVRFVWRLIQRENGIMERQGQLDEHASDGPALFRNREEIGKAPGIFFFVGIGNLTLQGLGERAAKKTRAASDRLVPGWDEESGRHYLATVREVARDIGCCAVIAQTTSAGSPSAATRRQITRRASATSRCPNASVTCQSRRKRIHRQHPSSSMPFYI